MILFKQYPLTAAAVPLSDSTIFGSILPSEITKVYQLIVINIIGAANRIYLGKSDVTNAPANAGFEVAAGAVITVGPNEVYLIDLRDIYIVGTVAGSNTALLTIIL